MMKIHGLTKSFDGKKIIKGFDFDINDGEVVAIIGPSGAGKTTALRCINFLETADTGTMEFDGSSFDMAHMKKSDVAQIRKRTGFVFQNFNLFLNKTALQNVTEGLVVARRVPKNEAVEKAKKMLDKVGLSDKYDSYPQALSGGQQQRVAIARALATDPEIIYFDEPTSALDPELTGEVLNVMKSLASEGMTMVVVTHELKFAQSVASRVVFMEDGAIVESGSSDQIFNHSKEKRTGEFISSVMNR